MIYQIQIWCFTHRFDVVEVHWPDYPGHTDKKWESGYLHLIKSNQMDGAHMVWYGMVCFEMTSSTE